MNVSVMHNFIILMHRKPCSVPIRATEILKSKSVRSTDDVIDVIRTWVRQSQIVTKTLHFHPKVYQKLIIFLTVQLQPVGSKPSKDNPKSLASDRCLLNTGVLQNPLWCLNPPIFSVSQRVSFFIKSLLVYKFQGRQPFRTFKLNIFFQTMQF